MAKLVKIAETKDLTPGQAAAFDVEGQKIALFNAHGTFYAIGDTCTHRGGPLSEGSVAGTTVTCPWHERILISKPVLSCGRPRARESRAIGW